MLLIHKKLQVFRIIIHSGGVKTTFSTIMRTLLGPRRPQCHNFDSTAGAGGFTAGAAAPAVNMLEEALMFVERLNSKQNRICSARIA